VRAVAPNETTTLFLRYVNRLIPCSFFRIYEYLETLPIEFFWDDGIDSIYMHELLGRVKSMTKEDADYLLMSAKYLSGRGYTSKNQI